MSRDPHVEKCRSSKAPQSVNWYTEDARQGNSRSLDNSTRSRLSRTPLSFITAGHGTSEKLQSWSNLLWNQLSDWFQPAREYLQFMWYMKTHGLAHFNCVSDWDRARLTAEVVWGAYFSTRSQEQAPFFFSFFIHMINKYGMRLWGQIGIGII